MATDITPLSTLYDHPSVFRIPKTGEVSKPAKKKRQSDILTEEEEPDLSDVEQARNAVKTALEGRKYGSLNEMLIPAPERPEYNQERAEKAKKLTKKAAIIQLIDSLTGIGELAAGGDSTIVAPVDYSGLGFEALNQLVDLDEQHRIDLRDFNKQKREVELKNQQIRQGAREYNQDIDLELAEREENLALDERQDHYRAALRYISHGKFDLAAAHLREAGLSPDGTIKKKTPEKAETPPETPLNVNNEIPASPPDAEVEDVKEPIKQDSTQKGNLANLQTLETVRTAIEAGLSENPDEATRQVLSERWKEITRDLLTSNDEVEGDVDFWVDILFKDMLREQNKGKSMFEDSEDLPDTGEPTGIFSVYNRLAKILSQPIYSGKNKDVLENLVGAPAGKGFTWKQIWERLKESRQAHVDESFLAKANGETDASKSDIADKQTLHQVQDAIGNSLASDGLDSKTRLILTRRWIKNNERLLELERPDLTEQERHTLSLEMFPQMMKEKQAEKQSDRPAPETIKPPTDLQPDRTLPGGGRLEIQDMRNSGQV